MFREQNTIIFTIGGHSDQYPWSVISDWAWYQNLDNGLKRAKSDIISDIGINFYPISDIPLLSDQPVGWEVICLPPKIRDLDSIPAGVKKKDVLISVIGMDSDIDTGTLPISKWQFSVWHIFFQY
jgi:hypothetical protein